MLNVVTLIDTPYIDIGGGTRIMISDWHCSLNEILAKHRNCDVYIYRPSLHSTNVRGAALTPSFINTVRRDSRR
jgi:hypothetical protein